MKKTTVMTRCLAKDQTYKETSAVVFENGTPGLFVGRLFVLVDRFTGEVAQTGKWNVYHHTGTVFPGYGFTTRKQAIEIMHKLSDLTDWTQDADAIGRDSALGDKVRRVYAGREA